MVSSAAVKPHKRARQPKAWWGDGRPPDERWPGSTIQIPAVWSIEKKRWESPDGRYYFDPAAAAKAEDFFPTFLTHHIGRFARQPFTLMDYQRLLVIRPLFGWLRSSNSMRRFRFVFLFVPKANGKSPIGSGLGLYLTLCDDEAGSEVFAMAGDKLQAKVVHGDARIMVEQSPDLSELCEVTRDSIYCPQSRSSYQVISADAPGKHGRRPHGVVIDELHNQPSRDLFEAFRKSMIKGEQPVMCMMSHAGTDDESICYEEYTYAKAVIRDPSYDESYLPVVFEAAPNADWTSPETWKQSNPAWGVTINPEIFAAECNAARNEPRKKNDFLRYNLNVWTNQATAWLPVEWWDACPSSLPPDTELQQLATCAGLDMSQKIDLASLVVTFKEPLETAERLEVVAENAVGLVEPKTVSLNYRVHLLPMFWIPENTMLEHERSDKVPYSIWAEQGWVIPTEGDVIDDDRIYRDILKLAERFPRLKEGEIGYDPAFATSLALRLQAARFKVVETPQNYRHISEPSQVFEALLKGKRITHNKNPCLRWNVENVSIKTDDARRIRPVKPKKAAKRIDGVVGAVMGIGRLIVARQEKRFQAFIL
jgi:phage terminase large subunit-like protein